MSSNSSAIRLSGASRSSRRYSPYSRSPCSSTLPSNQHALSSSGHDNHLSLASSSTGQHHQFPGSDVGRLVVPADHAEDNFSPAPLADHQSSSNISVQPPGYSMPGCPSRSPQCLSPHVETSALPTHPSAHPGLPSLPRPPQEQVLISQGSSHSCYQSQGIFSHAQKFVVKDSVFIDNNGPLDNFMEKLLQHTIIGAEFDSSDRDPPPRCHPGTRLEVLQRCLDFIVECVDKQKLRWIVGPAGVGKSAVMQTVSEKVPDGIISASVFFSVNGRRDGTKIIVTIAYQLAVKSAPYRQFIRDAINLDPSLLQKSLSAQFKKFIIEPFMHRRLFDTPRRFLVVIDGLDECNSHLAQQNILELISDFCVTYPSSPIAWIVASRPEPHITSFFERIEVQPTLIKEEIPIDSDEACRDVQRHLRAELNKIKLEYLSLRRKREWPSEHEFTKIASAARGLFAYASTGIRYIGDSRYRDPTAKLRHLLEAIDAGPRYDPLGRNHPMAQLDALYARILSSIPDDVMVNTRKLLLLNLTPLKLSNLQSFRLQCNLLGLSEDAGYGAICHLQAVADIPEPVHADYQRLKYYHKSFEDFLFDFKRSGFSHNVRDEALELWLHAFLGIIEQVQFDSRSVDSAKATDISFLGKLKNVPGSYDKISLSWPDDEASLADNEGLRYILYLNSVHDMGSRFCSSHIFNESISCFHALTTRFTMLGHSFPKMMLRESAFGKFCPELTELGKLKQVPLRTLNYAAICGTVEVRLMSPIEMNVEFADPWNPSCMHEKETLDGLQDFRGWSAQFRRYDRCYSTASGRIRWTNTVVVQKCHREAIPREATPLNPTGCDYCLKRFIRHFKSNLDEFATIFIDSTGLCYVEFSFVDPGDEVSEWRYRFFHSGRPKSIRV